jgi:hypothetical protein
MIAPMIRRIVIEVRDPDQMRYASYGDWQTKNGEGMISISDTGIPGCNAALMVHELAEYLLCRRDGISEHVVDAWDFTHADAEEPGELAGCPYRTQHLAATILEFALLCSFGEGPESYDAALSAIWPIIERSHGDQEG